MRNVQWNDAPVDAAFLGAMDLCVQCRGCETACPSSVPFGKLMVETRAAVAAVPWWQRIAYRVLPHHRLLLAGSSMLAGAQRLRVVPSRRLGLPNRLPLRRAPLRSSGTEVWLFTGCVMDAWQRDVHAALGRVLDAMGVGWRTPLPRRGGGCCGALHEHAGLAADAARHVEQALGSMPGGAPIVVDSAGCGAMLKQHSDRVFDVHEWLATHAAQLPAPKRLAVGGASVVIQDPCHLRHAQRTHESVRAVLRPYVASLTELDDEGLCCGAGGAYSALHPREAAAIRERKLAAIARAGAAVVASANPGCILHLAAAGVVVRHPIELIDEAVRDG
jgi:glycolate oxidase iron-sulfur subunit